MTRTEHRAPLSTDADPVVYGFVSTDAGDMLVARSPRGICYLGFAGAGDRDGVVRKMKKHLSRAVFRDCGDGAADGILAAWRGRGPMPSLDLRGTDFQRRVWQALLDIPFGKTVAYKDIAEKIGRPKAARAVGSAVAANPVSLLVPCHRVLPASGGVGHYAWGAGVKTRLLELEAQHIPHGI